MLDPSLCYEFYRKNSIKIIFKYIIVSEMKFLGPEILRLKFVNKRGYKYTFSMFLHFKIQLSIQSLKFI